MIECGDYGLFLSFYSLFQFLFELCFTFLSKYQVGVKGSIPLAFTANHDSVTLGMAKRLFAFGALPFTPFAGRITLLTIEINAHY